MDASDGENTFQQALRRLSEGVLDPPLEEAGLPSELAPYAQLVGRIQERWARERRQTIDQAVAAIYQSTELYGREVERAEQLEQAHDKLRRTHEQLVQASKMASLGTLAAGVAHEMNQPLTIILSLAELIQFTPNDPVHAHHDELERIVTAAERLADIVDNVRTYARQDSLRLEATAAAHPVKRAFELLETRLKVAGISVTKHFDVPRELTVQLDTGRMQQVFLNLITNAHDALLEGTPSGAEPEIEVRVQLVGDEIHYKLSDNGMGVSKEHESRLFDPFFTTKKAGHGTGLGLSVSRSIVEEHRGRLSHQRDALWTRFVVQLPLHDGSSQIRTGEGAEEKVREIRARDRRRNSRTAPTAAS